tara:strand:+ start:158 stop:319 length:162 start_codon:yes stop_codon:yes gene_type:complete
MVKARSWIEAIHDLIVGPRYSEKAVLKQGLAVALNDRFGDIGCTAPRTCWASE